VNINVADRPWQLLIGGELLAARTGATMPVIHPGDESVIAEIPLGSAGLHTALAAARDLAAGYVWVNWSSEHIVGASFGGVKNSGLGREESLVEIESYTQHQNVYLRF
jgi:acyl-CoA reductase-like NAD-dependent aldehyde dehydrogenase